MVNKYSTSFFAEPLAHASSGLVFLCERGRLFRCRHSALIVGFLLWLFSPSHSIGVAQTDLDAIKRATVFIYQVQSLANDLVVKCVSTGTIISADGLILTNAHSVLPSQNCDGETLIVSMNVDLNEPPAPKYRAEIANADQGLDIAVLRITRELDGRLIAAGALPVLPFVGIGASADVDIDDNILVAGYRGIGNQAVTVARGTITAFISEPRGGARAWFKTRAELPGTMAGGGAFDSQGQMIGIPTSAKYGRPATEANCRFIEDTTGDGLINSSDHCVPTGDFISTIRPIRLAQSLIRGAALGLGVQVHTVPTELQLSTEAPSVSRLIFSPSVVDGLPSTVVGAMPANTNSLYLFFDYHNMAPETVYELRVTRDGIPDATFSLPPVHWSGGQNGMWYIGSRDQPWPNGAYQFTLLLNGLAAASQQIVVGGGADNSARFSNIVFGLLDNQGNLIGNGYILPTGITAYARFLYANLTAGTPWSTIWYYGGAEVGRTNDIWSRGANGSDVVQLRPLGGLIPGKYRLELYLDRVLSATSDFVVAGGTSGPLPTVFFNGRYVSASSAFEARNATTSSGITEAAPAIFALFDWQNIAAGTEWTIRWLVDDLPFFESTYAWVTLESGADFMLSVNSPPDGKYQLQLLVNNLQILAIEDSVGIGQLPIDRLAEYEGALLRGRVLDAATLTGIASVTIVLIGEDYSASEFEWKAEQVFATATTDRNGDFQFARPLAADTPYSVIVAADGYLPLAADSFQFTADQQQVDITMELVRGYLND